MLPRRASVRPLILPCVAALFALCAHAGCARRAPTPSDTATLVIDNQPVSVALRELSTATATPIVVSAGATEVAACVRITVLVPQPVARAQLSRLVLRALESTPLAVQPSAAGWVVERRPAAPLPESCNALMLREGLLADLARRARERREALQPSPVAVDSADGGLAQRAELDPATSVLAGISASGEASFTVTPAARDALFSDSTRWMSQIRLVPRVEQGRTRGLALYGIRRTSVFAALGLQNGDVLVSLNGDPVADPERMLEAYARLRRATETRALIERRGAPLTLVYRVADAPR